MTVIENMMAQEMISSYLANFFSWPPFERSGWWMRIEESVPRKLIVQLPSGRQVGRQQQRRSRQ